MTKKKEENRKSVEVRVDVDTDRFYGNLEDAIKYLQEIHQQYDGIDIGLDEHWTGYEDIQMTFVYNRRAKKKRASDLAEYERLRSSLGFSR